jgi:hypothetical protein
MICLSMVAALNYIVNPIAEFSHELIPPIVQLSRKEKIRHFYNYIKQYGSPKIIVLGSSRSMMLKAKKISEKMETVKNENWPVFHFALNSATVEDYYAVLRFVLDNTPSPPELLLIAQDFRVFNPDMPIDIRILSTPKLYNYLIEAGHEIPVMKNLERFKKLFSADYTLNSINALNLFLKGNIYEDTFDRNGDYKIEITSNYYIDETIVQKLLIQNLEEGGNLYHYNFLEEKRLLLLEEIYRLAKKNNIYVITWLTTVHPAQFKQIFHESSLKLVYKKLIEREKQLAARYDIVIFQDIMNPEVVNCDETNFYKDLTHYSEKCAEIILNNYLFPLMIDYKATARKN